MSETPFPSPQQGGLSTHLVTEISEQIEAGILVAGDKLATESSLAMEYNISRSVVREALSQLQARGYISRRRGSGTYVNELPSKVAGFMPELVKTTHDALQMVELRICLESESAAMAAANRTPEQLKQIKEENQRFLDALNRGESNTTHDKRFHQLIAEASSNKYFLDMTQYLGEAMIPRSRLNKLPLSAESQAALLQRLEQEHLDICHAIERQDVEGARTTMKMHLINSRVRLQQLLASEQPHS